MKTQIVLTATLITLLTAVQPILAAEDSSVRTKLDEGSPITRLSDLDTHINPQLGISSFEYSGKAGGGKSKLTGGATAEFGGSQRKFETGLLVMQTGVDTTLSNGQTSTVNVTYLTLPMMAKLRILQMRSQAWYAKFGGLTALTIGSNNRGITNGADVMISGGVGGRFAMMQKADFLIEATYNRGLLEAVHTNSGSAYNQGFIVLAGLSFRL